jgi:hypothetical protein
VPSHRGLPCVVPASARRWAIWPGPMRAPGSGGGSRAGWRPAPAPMPRSARRCPGSGNGAGTWCATTPTPPRRCRRWSATWSAPASCRARDRAGSGWSRLPTRSGSGLARRRTPTGGPTSSACSRWRCAPWPRAARCWFGSGTAGSRTDCRCRCSCSCSSRIISMSLGTRSCPMAGSCCRGSSSIRSAADGATGCSRFIRARWRASVAHACSANGCRRSGCCISSSGCGRDRSGACRGSRPPSSSFGISTSTTMPSWCERRSRPALPPSSPATRRRRRWGHPAPTPRAAGSSGSSPG